MPKKIWLANLVKIVLASPKYKNMDIAFVERVAARELSKGRNLKEVVKATKNKLHQVGGVYLERGMRYDAWLGELKKATAYSDRQALKVTCKEIMQQHASTRERLPILDEFYTAIFAELPPIRSVLDLACGLNPLALPWMALADGATYYACDIYTDLTALLHDFLRLLPVQGEAWACDVLAATPTQKVDLALVLKTIPCLEQVEKDAGKRLLDNLNAEYILVSYPLQSLSGREKGMLEHYEAGFRELVAGRGWEIKRFVFETELAFLVGK